MKTPHRHPKSRRARPQKGVALIMTLIVLVLLSILVTGFVVSMRTEMRASYSNENIQRTKMIAQGALSHAIDLLRTNIPDPARLNERPGRFNMDTEFTSNASAAVTTFGFSIEGSSNVAPAENWVVNPGRLTIIKAGEGPTFVDLHTGAANDDSDVTSVDLNQPLAGESTPSIVMGTDQQGHPDPGAPAPVMRVEWVNVYEDPSEAPGPENPMVGRYAFWIDDECAKINFNTALGKPAPGEDTEFDNQLHGTSSRVPMLTPVFNRGVRDQMDYTGSLVDLDNTVWALGHPGSVNLDILLDYGPYDRDNLLDDKLLVNNFRRGFSRFPEAIIEYIDTDGGDWRDQTEETAWYRANRFNLTHYSRAPEFNVFGFPRYFTTNVPLSLESGPLYQLPFTYGTGDNQILHLHSLMGTFGYTDNLTVGAASDEEGELDTEQTILAGNVVNRAQIDPIMRYLYRSDWPGYEGTRFLNKYGYSGGVQLATSIMRMARVATTTMTETNPDAFMRAWSFRNTSTNFVPASGINTQQRPERMYWRFQPADPGQDTILPQMGGPHIMEVHFEILPKFMRHDDKTKEDIYHLRYRFGGEWYMHPYGPIVARVNTRTPRIPEALDKRFAFPMHVDYLKFDSFQLNGTATLEPDVASDASLIGEYTHTGWDLIQRPNLNGGVPIRMGVHRAEINPLSQWLGPAGASFDIDGMINQEKLNLRSLYEGNDGPPDGISNRIFAWSPLYKMHRRDNWPFDSRGGATENPPNNELFEVRIPNPSKGPGASAELEINFTFRCGMGVQTSRVRPKQMIPRTSGITGLPGGNVTVLIDRSGKGHSDPSMPSNKVVWETADPRISNRPEDWILDPDRTGSRPQDSADTSDPGFDPDDGLNVTVGEPTEYSSEKSKFLVLQRALDGSKVYGFDLQRGDEYATNSRVISPGYWSLLHTGMVSPFPAGSESGPEPYRTMDLGPGQGSLPDWLLLDLFGATYPAQRDQWRKTGAGPDQFSSISYMNSTMGKINLNTKIYPDNPPYFDVPDRRLPIEAVFKYLRSDNKIDALVDDIIGYQNPNQWFDYIGELSEVGNSYDDTGGLPHQTQFEEEALLRNMAGCLTTNSNTFGVYGIAQTVKKTSSNSNFTQLELGDQILGEKRFYAIVERHVWPGKDGVPGNAHVNPSTGLWDKIADDSLNATGQTDDKKANTLFHLPGSPPLRGNQNASGEYLLNIDNPFRGNNNRPPSPGGTYPILDGPEEVGMGQWPKQALGGVEYEASSLEDAYNPPQAAMKYRIVYFKFLDS